MRFAGWPSPPPSRRPVADQLAQVACLQVVVPVMVQAFVGMLVLVQALVGVLVLVQALVGMLVLVQALVGMLAAANAAVAVAAARLRPACCWSVRGPKPEGPNGQRGIQR